jgi:lysophospholipase L1-like esterase
VIVALGDSLAANVGVDDAPHGYVSRVHAELQRQDGVAYGLRNFGVSGETTGTMIRNGQLDVAISYMETVEVAYVTIDIGANDLLGHLGSDDCADDIDAPACTKRLEAAFATYRANLAMILDRLAAAAPDATIVYLTAYNPFSLGLSGGVGFERRSDEILRAFNDIGAALAIDRGILAADGFTPMQGTTAATTHMLDAASDIHPRGIGYDILAGAIIDAITGSA